MDVTTNLGLDDDGSLLTPLKIRPPFSESASIALESGLIASADMPAPLPDVVVDIPITPNVLAGEAPEPFVTPNTPIPPAPLATATRPALASTLDVASAFRAAGGRFMGDG